MRILAELIESAGQGIYPCLFHLVTGAYCPGCGGTRALLALLHGRLADSIRLNPLVLYMAVSIPSFLLYRFYCAGEKEAGTACGMDDGIRRRNYNTGNELYYKELFSAGKACGFTGAYLLTAACRLSAFLRGAVEI